MSEQFAHPVVSIIVEHGDFEGHVLLQKRMKSEPDPLSGLHELPQGRLRYGESLLDCASRELKEETGLENLRLRSQMKSSLVLGESLEEIDVLAVVDTGQHSYLGIYVVGTADGVPRASTESSDPSWYSKEQILDLIKLHRVFPLNVPMLLSYYAERGLPREGRKSSA
jgi:8-oxo-dGTP pyrophosphatase MutT (NUDIX family)